MVTIFYLILFEEDETIISLKIGILCILKVAKYLIIVSILKIC